MFLVLGSNSHRVELGACNHPSSTVSSLMGLYDDDGIGAVNETETESIS